MSRRWMQLRLHNNNNRILRILLFIWQIYLTKESIVNCSQRCHNTEFSFLCSQDETIFYLSRRYRKWQVDTELLLLFESTSPVCTLCVQKRCGDRQYIYLHLCIYIRTYFFKTYASPTLFVLTGPTENRGKQTCLA